MLRRILKIAAAVIRGYRRRRRAVSVLRAAVREGRRRERDAHVVRRVDGRTGVVSTIAGTGNPGFSGDGGPATRAELRQPHSIAFDAAGHLLICDIGNSRIRSVDMKIGVIRTFAGTGERQPTPDEGSLESTPLQGPRSIDTDEAGNVYLVLREGNAVFRIDARTRRLKRIAGTGEAGLPETADRPRQPRSGVPRVSRIPLIEAFISRTPRTMRSDASTCGQVRSPR